MSKPLSKPVTAHLDAETYAKLRRVARSYLSKEKVGHTLVATGLVHEAYLRLLNEPSAKQAYERGQIPAIARLMREILINHAIAKKSQKRGGGRLQITFSESVHVVGAEPETLDLIELDQALKKLQEEDTQLAQLVECRFFIGLTIAETAKALNVSPATVKRNWNFAKSWIQHAMEKNKK